jgi:small-conductance mechanosensitive channel
MEEQQVHKHRPPQESDYNNVFQQNLPNSKTVLVIGILSLVFSCWYFSIVGVLLSIFTLVLANRDLTLYYSNKNLYTLSSYNNLKAGRVCAIIGLVVGIVFIIFIILIVVGIIVTWPFWGMID